MLRSIAALCTLIAATAHAGPPDDALAVWQKHIALEAAFDPASVDLLTEDSVMLADRVAADGSVERQELAIAKVRAQWPQIMASAKAMDDRSTYDDVAIAPDPRGFRVTARRTSLRKCSEDPGYSAILVKTDAGWRLAEQYSKVFAQSQCPPDEKRAAALATENAALYAPQLPLQVDDETRLDTIVAEGPLLRWQYTLVSIPSTFERMDTLMGVMGPLTLKSTCGMANLRTLLDAGGTVVYEYTGSDGKPIPGFRYTGADCP